MAIESDAVIIGAGAFGCSLAFHLAQRGKRVALVDRFAAASQTSPRAAGLFKQIQSTPTRTRLAVLSVNKLMNFEGETGLPSPAVASGSLMVARTPEHAAYVRREAEQSKEWGADIELVDAAEAHRRMPMIEGEGLLAAAYSPDIYIEEPIQLLSAYLTAGKARGVQILENMPVTGIRMERDEVRGVTTPNGEIDAPIVVDAAGAWARAIGALGGTNVPIVPMRHQLYITHPIPGADAKFPIIRYVDSAVYVRPARGGLMLGGFESDPMPLDVRKQPNFTMDQVPLDFSILEKQTALVENSIPALRDTTIQEHRGGLFTMTQDGHFLAGPMPGVRGLWALTGCNGSGFSFSPALGQVMAEWIAEGQPSIDLVEFSPSRFANRQLSDEELTAACIWQYAHYYDPAQ
ncbi:MAG TPA: FAD-dependent oxidoreductase [Anaerolineae bacterium]|nr:FAD-dependent oxidoreductase [Anaerolineae bacterium]